MGGGAWVGKRERLGKGEVAWGERLDGERSWLGREVGWGERFDGERSWLRREVGWGEKLVGKRSW